MRIASILLLMVLATATFMDARPATACPLCKEAIAASDGGTPPTEEDVNNLPLAYNRSILFMIAVPYTSLAVIGFLIYRGVKKNQEYLARANAGDPQKA